MKKAVSLILVLALAVSLATVSSVFGASAATWDGNSIDTSWYQPDKDEFRLSTPEQLAGLSALVNGKDTEYPDGVSFENKTVLLDADIYLGNKPFTPIGHSLSGAQKFAGTFNGQDHSIFNLNVTMVSVADSGNRFGLFGTLTGTCKNLNIKSAEINTPFDCYSAFIAGHANGGKIVSCTVDTYSKLSCVSSSNGAFAGRVENGGIIDSCINNAPITCTALEGSTKHVIVGGIAGLVGKSTVSYCVNYGKITADATNVGEGSQQGVGGIAGFSNVGSILNCVNEGDVSLTHTAAGTGTAGIVGKWHAGAGSTVENCYNFGSVTGANGDTTRTALIVGHAKAKGTVKNSGSLSCGSLELVGTEAAGSATAEELIIAEKDSEEYKSIRAKADEIEKTLETVPVTLTVHYVDEAGNKLAEDVVQSVYKGGTYRIVSPVIEGYDFDKDVVEGTVEGNTELTVTYKKKVCTVTVKYVYEDGKEAAADKTETGNYGDEFSITSPKIEGFTPNFAEVKGKFETTRTITVKYKAAPTSDTSSDEPNNTTEAPSSGSDTSSTKPNEGGSCASCSSFAALPLLALSAVALLGTALVTKKK